MLLSQHSERVALYKEFNDAFKEYIAKRITPEEYTTICGIVTQGFVELSVEIQALEAHLGDGTTPNTTAPSTTDTTTIGASPSRLSLQSSEHAQLIRDVQNLERTKLQITVQGQKLMLAREEQERQEEVERRAEEQDERVVDEASRIAEEEEERQGVSQQSAIETDGEATTVQQSNGCHHHHHHLHHDHHQPRATQQPRVSSGIVLDKRRTPEEWDVELAENKAQLDQIVEDINEKLADINEAIAILVL
ncbi:hypothetical protein BGW42_006048 [Actinomortierella wolfii]|nr:hypothetical protein BGW42_006048 [Actinomortierella wolfii]